MLTGESDPEAEDMLTRSFLRFKDVNESDVRKQMEENDTLRHTLETARNEVVCYFSDSWSVLCKLTEDLSY